MVAGLITSRTDLSTAPEGNPRFRGLKIGLFGGSFNPPHAGHTHVAHEALRRLKLDEVWWIVANQNPLKGQSAPFAKRLAATKKHIADMPKCRVSNIEDRMGLQYSVDTVTVLRQMAPTTQFVFLMSADSFQNLDRWRDWQTLASRIPIAVFNRKGYSISALNGRAAKTLGSRRVPERRAERLVSIATPAWAYIHTPSVAISSTDIRSNEAR